MVACALLWDTTTEHGVVCPVQCDIDPCPPELVSTSPPEAWKDGIRATITEQRDPKVQESARYGAASAYKVLQSAQALGSSRRMLWPCQRNLRNTTVIRRGEYFFATPTFTGAAQVQDNSGGLLFALLCAEHLVQHKLGKQVDGSYAATGVLEKRNSTWVLCPVSHLKAKLTAALPTLEAGSKIFYPREQDKQIDPHLKEQLSVKLVLCPVDTVEEAIQELLGSIICIPHRFPPWISRAVGLTGLVALILSASVVGPRLVEKIVAPTRIELLSGKSTGVIVFPTPDTVVTSVGTVRTQIFLPNTYAAVAIVPTHDSQCWVQNDGRRVTPSVEFSLPVSYGGKDTYQVFVGVTYDAKLFQEGQRLPHCPHQDSNGQPVVWIGPVKVAHE